LRHGLDARQDDTELTVVSGMAGDNWCMSGLLYGIVGNGMATKRRRGDAVKMSRLDAPSL